MCVVYSMDQRDMQVLLQVIGRLCESYVMKNQPKQGEPPSFPDLLSG